MYFGFKKKVQIINGVQINCSNTCSVNDVLNIIK